MRCPECGHIWETAQPSPQLDSFFERFWELYPKKVGRKPSYQKILKLDPNPALQARILKGLRWQVNLLWDDLRYIPNPATWIYQERWMDEPPEDIKSLLEKDELGPIVYPVRHGSNRS